MNEDSQESFEALQGNNENIKYLMINYSPLIFINGFYFKGNYDDTNHLMESFCNSFENPPKECSKLTSFMKSDELNTTHLAHFIMISCLICLLCAVMAILIFYILIKKRIRKKFNYELNDKINEALAKYYGDENEESEDDNQVIPEVETAQK